MSLELGKTLIKNKNYKEALSIFNNLLKNEPNNLRVNFHLGRIFYELNNLEKCNYFFEKCNNIQPNTANVIFNLALTLQSRGKLDEAKRQYLKLISINSKDVKAYYGLFVLNSKNIDKEFQLKLKNLVGRSDVSLFEKSLINFIFSKIEKEQGNLKNEINYLKISHEQSFNSNLLINSQSDLYYKDIISNKYNEINFKRSFEKIDEFNNGNHIFIIGLPRSGSTLVETIINHNSKNIVSVGEFHGVNTSIINQIGKVIYSNNFALENFNFNIDKKEFQDSLISRYDNFKIRNYLDKSLENFFNIEIILNFFPNAKFVHTYRDIKDAVIGIYQTMLSELSWSHSIQSIYNYTKNYLKIMNYFNKKYPDKIISVKLNELTNEKEIQTKKILNFCNIDVKDDFLAYNENNKLFNKTNSFLQVREKIKQYDYKKYEPYYYLLKGLKF